ncbi:diguanylate cyclase [Aestuariibacter halophilus]|uniref:diguanylate cyclase n=1 Tax=Fluctibacter halophilus TaxID=226011 RepID=A0ABS8GAS3_9ALTE|nr:diguanylate cyclase [Aestuariibacter halophilus]MCC2617276.1 diguanylate cyclase [Aestuariibacter halophilus]
MTNWLRTLLMLLCLSGAASAAQPVTTFSQPYADWLVALNKHPDKIISELQRRDAEALNSDIERAQYHYVLSLAYYAQTYPRPALEYAKRAMALTDPQVQPWLFFHARLAESLALDLLARSDEGLVGANAALVWAQLADNTELMVHALYVRGQLRISLVDYQGALQDLQNAYEQASDDGLVSRAHIASVLALVYEYRREDGLAVPFFEEAASYHREQGNTLELSVALYGLGRANSNLGEHELGRQQLEESAELARSIRDLQGVAYALKELAGLAFRSNELDRAKRLYTEAQSTFDLAQNRYMQLDTSLSLARIALAEGVPDIAYQHIERAYGFLDPATMPLQQLAIDEIKAQWLAKTGQYQAAYEQLQATVPRKQKLMSERSTEQLHSLRAQYEINAKERENRLLEQRNHLTQSDLQNSRLRFVQLTLLFVASLIICVLLIVLVYRTRKARAQLERLANYDSLTGVANRRFALERLQLQLELANRHGFDLVVVIVDLDHFKRINDTHGHGVGDQVLSELGQLCLRTFRATDVVGRIGGEEFLIGLVHTGLEDAKKIIKSFSLKVNELSDRIGIEGLRLSISCGLVLNRTDTSLTQLMAEADQALYDAKANGRDQFVVCTPKQ